MITVKDTPSKPISFPEERYGIELRPYKPADFIAISVWGLILLAAIGGVVARLFFGQDEGWLVAGAFTAPIAVMAVLGCSEDVGARKRDADAVAKKKFYEWEYHELWPYLEEKYGVKFQKNSPSFTSWNYPIVIKDNRSFEVNLHGVDFARNSFSGSGLQHTFWFPVRDKDQDIWMEEVVRPDRVTYKAMEVA